MNLIYLASPYSVNAENDPVLREIRFIKTCKAFAALQEMYPDHIIYSPIVNFHYIAIYADLPKGHEYYDKYHEYYISKCDFMVILKLDGWDISEGVEKECTLADKYEKHIDYLEESEI